jgi:hypothetical protein
MRAVLGLIVGLVVSIVVAVIAGCIGVVATFTLPPGTDPTNIDQVFATFASMSQATWLALAAAWFLGGLAGAWVGTTIARAPWAGWVVALLVALYFGANAFALLLPSAMKAAWILGPLLGGLIGNQLARRAAAPAAATTEAGDVPADI